MKRSRSIGSILFVLMLLVVTFFNGLADIGTTVVNAADIPFYNGLALQFGNASNKLSHTGPLTTQTDNITMEAWVNIDNSFVPAGQFIRIMYNGNSATSGYGIYFYYNSTTGLIEPCILIGSVGFVFPNPEVYISKGKWHHLAAVREGGLWKLYVDGILSGSGNPGGANIPATEFSIGNSSYSNENFIGCIDEVRFWTVARSVDDIKNNMYIKLQGNEAGLLGYYNFEETGVTAGGNNNGITSTVTNKAATGSTYDLSLINFGLNGPTSNFVQSVQLGQFQFENPTYSVVENSGNVRINITRTSGTEGVVTLNYSTSDNTALAGTNYSSVSGSVTFSDGQTTKEIVIPISYRGISDTKNFTVALSAQSGVTLLNNSTTVNILPDTIAPSISDVSKTPVSTTNGDVTVTVTASDASGIATTGGYSFDGGSTWQDENSMVYFENTTIAAGQIQVKDKSGNIAAYGTDVVISNIDKTGPDISLVEAAPASPTNGNVTVTVTASDASGIATTGGYSFDGGSTWQDENSKIYSVNTTIVAGQIQVKDTFGNITSYESSVVINNIDKSGPNISSVEASPASPTNGNVTVTVTASDTSGIAVAGGYSFDGGLTWQDGNSKVYSVNTTIAAGQIRVKDTLGNITSYGSEINISNIDNTLPVLVAGAVSRTTISDGTVKYTSSKAGKYYYQIVSDGAPAPSIDTTGTGVDCSAGENTISLTGVTDFDKDIYIKVKDSVGNVSNTLKIDLDGYSSTTANSSNNNVTVSSISVFAGGSVAITASGDRQATLSGSSYGDERFIPYSWTSEEVGKSGTFSLNSGNYTSTYTTLTAGNYTITIEYVKQQWDGFEWQDAGTDNKTIGLTVREPGGFSLNTTPGDRVVSIEWAPVAGAEYYNIYKNNTFLRSVTADITQLDVINLINGTTYNLKVEALNSDDSVISISGAVSVTPRTVPGSPTNVKATAGGGMVTVTFAAPQNNGGSPITGYIVTSNPDGKTATGTATTINVSGLVNGTTYTFTVKAINAVGNSADSLSSNAVTPYTSSTTDNSGGNSNTQSTPVTTTQSGVQILINGKTETAATAVTTIVEDKTITTVTVDDAKVEEKLKSEGNNTVVTIPVNYSADVVVGQLNGQVVKNMEAKEAVLEVKTQNAVYTLPASQINIDDVSEQIGQQVELKDIKVEVTISAPSEDTIEVVENTANKNNYQVVVKPVEFDITCSSGTKTVEVSKFNAYVERMVAIPDGIDPSKITTGIVLNADGTFSHVPTTIVKVDGKYYAKINSLTNSTYSVIWSPKTFRDVENHWARDAVNDMASRLVISGSANDMFEPDRDITRGEFASVVVKALGLMRPGTGKACFSDVVQVDWYFDAVSIAYEYGIITGYENGKFGPTEKITREQAMTMIARAMKITGLKAEFNAEDIISTLGTFKDSDEASGWAKESIGTCVKAGIVQGKNGKMLAPKDNITRAEVAVIVRGLLQKSKLIN